MNIHKIVSFKNLIIAENKLNKIIKEFNKNFNLYYQWIEPKICNLELYLTFQKELIIHEAKVFKKINITLNNYLPDNLSNGIIKISDNLLIYIESEEFLKPIIDQTHNINKSISKLSNQKFLENANIKIIELEKNKLEDSKNLQAQKKLNDFFEKYRIDFIDLLLKYYSLEKIYWYIQYYREKNTIFEEYSTEWFEYVYNTDIIQDEINFLINLTSKN